MVSTCQSRLFTCGSDCDVAPCPTGSNVQSIIPFWNASIIEVTLSNTW